MVVQEEEGGGDNGVLSPTQIRREPTQWRAAVYARLGTCAQTVSEIQQLNLQKFAEMERRLRRMESLVRTMSTPARPIATVTTQAGTPIRVGRLAFSGDQQQQETRPAILSRNPWTLSVLWDEWMNGIGGNLPARSFEPVQRGQRGVKANYSFRKPFWKCMERLINSGSNVATALQRIDDVYSRYGSVTKQLKQIGRDEKNGGHEALQCS